MDHRNACRILGIQKYTDEQDLKKKYREMMQLAHPDNHTAETCAYDAREINEAYDYLKRHPDSAESEPQRTAPIWEYHAPVNENAYMERSIFHRIEGKGGEVLGTIEIGRGKYYWTKDEEFSLFLLSIYTCTRELLSELGSLSQKRQEYLQGDLSLLLAKQFILQEKTLSALVKHAPDADGTEIYTVPASLELFPGASSRKNGSHTFYPSKLDHHRLYLKDEQGLETGYLSFADDRLYYIIIPIFEDHRVQIKCTSRGAVKNTKAGKRYMDLELKIRFIKDAVILPENDSLRIESLLREAGRNN